jgi:hypothetical protein
MLGDLNQFKKDLKAQVNTLDNNKKNIINEKKLISKWVIKEER